MKPIFQENTEINKEKTKESEEKHKNFLRLEEEVYQMNLYQRKT